MIIVSDTTTISNLVQINELEILKKLYTEIIIPVSVFNELQVLIETELVSKEELQKDWIIVKSVGTCSIWLENFIQGEYPSMPVMSLTAEKILIR